MSRITVAITPDNFDDFVRRANSLADALQHQPIPDGGSDAEQIRVALKTMRRPQRNETLFSSSDRNASIRRVLEIAWRNWHDSRAEIRADQKERACLRQELGRPIGTLTRRETKNVEDAAGSLVFDFALQWRGLAGDAEVWSPG